MRVGNDARMPRAARRGWPSPSRPMPRFLTSSKSHEHRNCVGSCRHRTEDANLGPFEYLLRLGADSIENRGSSALIGFGRLVIVDRAVSMSGGWSLSIRRPASGAPLAGR